MRLGIIFSETNCKAALLKQGQDQIECLHVIEIEKDQLDESWKKSALLSIKNTYGQFAQVILGVENQSVIIRELTLDSALTDEQILHYLKTQSQHLFGHPASALATDYEILETKNETNQLIRVVSAHQSDIEKSQKLFANIGFALDVIDVDLFALARFSESESRLINKTNLSDQALREFAITIGLALWSPTCEH